MIVRSADDVTKISDSGKYSAKSQTTQLYHSCTHDLKTHTKDVALAAAHAKKQCFHELGKTHPHTVLGHSLIPNVLSTEGVESFQKSNKSEPRTLFAFCEIGDCGSSKEREVSGEVTANTDPCHQDHVQHCKRELGRSFTVKSRMNLSCLSCSEKFEKGVIQSILFTAAKTEHLLATKRKV